MGQRGRNKKMATGDGRSRLVRFLWVPCVVLWLFMPLCYAWRPSSGQKPLQTPWEGQRAFGFSSFLQLREVRFPSNIAGATPSTPGPGQNKEVGAPDASISSTSRRIRGKIKLNKQLYNTICDCENADTTHSCHAPRRLRVHQEELNAKLGLSREALKDVLGKPKEIKLYNAKTANFACLDGRNQEAVLATPGGEFGELLNALATVETLTRQKLTEVKVLQIVRKYMNDITGSFFACSDEDAVQTLERNIHVNGQANVVVGLKVDNPKPDYRDDILKLIVKPQHQGDYFLKAVLADPRRFYIRKALAYAYIRAFYQVLWDRDLVDRDGTLLANKIKFVIYEGEPKEQAWINFRSNHHCEQEHRAPAFNPKNRIWANHPEAVTVFRKRLARFLLTAVKLPMKWKTLTAHLDRRGRFIMEQYAEVRAAASSPFYTVVVE